jgi:hypothetical protein
VDTKPLSGKKTKRVYSRTEDVSDDADTV